MLRLPGDVLRLVCRWTHRAAYDAYDHKACYAAVARFARTCVADTAHYKRLHNDTLDEAVAVWAWQLTAASVSTSCDVFVMTPLAMASRATGDTYLDTKVLLYASMCSGGELGSMHVRLRRSSGDRVRNALIHALRHHNCNRDVRIDGDVFRAIIGCHCAADLFKTLFCGADPCISARNRVVVHERGVVQTTYSIKEQRRMMRIVA